jgi:hypothetical protein
LTIVRHNAIDGSLDVMQTSSNAPACGACYVMVTDRDGFDKAHAGIGENLLHAE